MHPFSRKPHPRAAPLVLCEGLDVSDTHLAPIEDRPRSPLAPQIRSIRGHATTKVSPSPHCIAHFLAQSRCARSKRVPHGFQVHSFRNQSTGACTLAFSRESLERVTHLEVLFTSSLR